MSLRLVDRLAARLLRAHVAQRARARSRPGSWRASPCARCRRARSWRRRLEQLGEAEVEDLGVAVRRHDHVLGLDVPVDDAGLVRLLQSARRPGSAISIAPSRSSSRAWISAFTVLPSTSSIAMKRPSSALVDVVDLGDRGVDDRAAALASCRKRRLALVVAGELRGQHLERDRRSSRVSRAR